MQRKEGAAAAYKSCAQGPGLRDARGWPRPFGLGRRASRGCVTLPWHMADMPWSAALPRSPGAPSAATPHSETGS